MKMNKIALFIGSLFTICSASAFANINHQQGYTYGYQINHNIDATIDNQNDVEPIKPQSVWIRNSNGNWVQATSNSQTTSNSQNEVQKNTNYLNNNQSTVEKVNNKQYNLNQLNQNIQKQNIQQNEVVYNSIPLNTQLNTQYNIASASLPSGISRPKAYAVYNYTKGQIVESHNINESLPIASITKLMTAVTFYNQMNNGNYNVDECISMIKYEDSDFIKGTKSRLPKDKPITCNALMMAMLISSDNTAAHALSRSINNNNRSQFIATMNSNAKRFNMLNTHFSDSSGLSPSNKSSVIDLINLAHYSLQYFPIRQMTSSYGVVVNGVVNNKVINENGQEIITQKPYTINYRNTNALIRNYANNNSAIKMNMPIPLLSKTGYIRESGYNLLMVQQNVMPHCNNNDVYMVISLGNPSINNRIKFTENKFNHYCKYGV